MRHGCFHLLCELLSLTQDGLASLHPNGICIWSEGNRTLNAVLGAALDAVVALNGASSIPIKVDVSAAHALRLGSHVCQRHLPGLLEPSSGILACCLQCFGHSFRECHATRTCLPIAICALLCCLKQGLHTLHCSPFDEGVVNWIDGRVNHGRRLCISSRNNHQGTVEHICLQPDGDQARDVLCNRHQDLATHVAALLGAWFLILNVNASSTILDEHLGQLHGGSEPSMSGVCISNDRVEVVHQRLLCKLLSRHVLPCSILLAIMEHLCSKELVHLVGDGVIRVVAHIGTWLIGSRCSG
mmetsp:Transcript_60742/g.112706  ORF Transcript_60742/g.112706 Transcript_60742/m.112706 type:complete len:299 (+) Transcript_60742:662-1558(+)